MKKFEYKNVVISMKKLINEVEYLNDMGNNGWDLIQIIPYMNTANPDKKGGHVCIFLKREKGSESAGNKKHIT